MTTKIHTGYRFACASIPDLYARLLRFQAQAMRLAEAMMADRVARLTAATIDRVAVGLETPGPDDGPPMIRALNEMIMRHNSMRATGQRDPFVDLDCLLCLFQNGDGFVYATLTAEQLAYREIWEATPEVEPYFYWNNGDKPKDIDEDEWARRDRIWHGLFDAIHGRSAPWRFYAVDHNALPLPKPDAVIAALPEFEARVAAVARALALQRKAETMDGAALRRWTRTDDFKAAIEVTAPSVRARLKPVLEQSDLLNEPHPATEL